MNGNLYPKNNVSLEIYRGDTLRIFFENIESIDSGIITVQFQVRLEPDTTLLVNKDVLNSDEGNDWANGIIAVNLTSGQTQNLPPDKLLRYDLRITRDGIVNADYFGNFYVYGDISGTDTIVDPVSVTEIYAKLASTNSGEGAGLIGALSSYWNAIVGTLTVEGVLQYLYENTLKKINPFTGNKLLKSHNSDAQLSIESGITIDSNDSLTNVGDVDLKSGYVFKINGAQIDTDDIPEGVTNLYYSDTLFGTSFASRDTDDLSEGATNLYFLESRVRDYIKAVLSTNGDILYRDGFGNLQRLAIGTNGQVLAVVTGMPAWSSSASVTQFIDLSDVPSSYTGESLKLVRVNSGETALEFTNTFSPPTLIVNETQTPNTSGGTFTNGALRTRNINTVIANTITGASIGSNQITLPAGTYKIDALIPSASVAENNAILYNVTDAAVVTGCTSTSGFASNAVNTNSFVFIKGQFTIASSKVFEIQHECAVTVATFGFGRPANLGSRSEIYTVVEITKIG